MTLLVKQQARVPLPGIHPTAYEHPADRAALSALRKIPGFDVVLRKLIGFVGERSVRYLHLANAVRVGPNQFPKLHRVYSECVRTLDVHPVPELFVSQTPLVNAGALGVDRPFIVVNSGMVELMDEDELRFTLGHELGHILSDHALYKTMLGLLLQISLSRLSIAAWGLVGIISALKEWDRKSELTADRAGLLAVQDAEAAFRVHMKLAGGARVQEMSVDAFLEQSRDYEQGGSAVDGVFKLLNLLGHTHPFPVTRLRELKHWIDSGDYGRILSGQYASREEGSARSLYEDFADGARRYREDYERSEDPLGQLLKDVSEAGQGALGKARDFLTSKR